MLTLKPYAVCYGDNALLLMLRKNDTVSQLATKAADDMGQKPIDTLQIILAHGNFPKNKRMFTMPNQILVNENVFCNTEEGKSICYLDVAECSSSKLDSIVSALVGADKVCEGHKYRIAIANY